jgi:ribosome assembly protein 1
MPVVPPERLIQLQQNADNVRNICIMAHVVSRPRLPPALR